MRVPLGATSIVSYATNFDFLKNKLEILYKLFAPPPWKCYDTLLSSAAFAVVVVFSFCFQNHFFKIILLGILFECQTDWIQIRPNILSDLIWVQSVCKNYQQMTLRR